MNLYLLIFLLLAAGTLSERRCPGTKEKVYWVCWGASAVCLCLRFGQGTDYVTYHAIYETIPTVVDLSQGYIFGFFPEPGWRLICALFKLCHAPFWVFTMALGAADMLLLHRFLQKYAPLKTAGLFLSYPALYIVWMVSGLRQVLAMCLFLGILVPFYLEKKWGRYVAGVLIAASFHKVGYGWLVLPAVYYLPMEAMLALTGLSAAGGLILQAGAVEQFFVRLIPAYHVKQFLLEGSISIFATGERLLSFGVLTVLYIWNRKKDGQADKRTELLLKAYMCGTCFYMLLCGSSYYASRYGVIFKVLECAVVMGLIQGRELPARAAAAFFFALTLLMGYKNLNAMISEGGYAGAGISVWNFPYVSVFNQDRIEAYRPYGRLLEERYEDNIGDQQLWMIEDTERTRNAP